MNRRDAIRAVMAMPAVTSIAVAKVEPDDVIVLECEDSITPEYGQMLKKQALEVWPGRKIVVLSGGLKLRIARATDV